MKPTTKMMLSLATLCGGVSAQDLGVKSAPQGEPIVIRNARVYPVSSAPIEKGFVLFVDGKIRQVGREGEALKLPERVMPREIDASGKRVYPGMIAAVTTLGLSEIGAVRSTQDSSETGDVTPEVRAAVAVNPDSTHLPVTRSNGVLVAGVVPGGGVIPGRASVIQLDGWTWEDMAVLDDAGLVISWPNVRPVRARWMERSDEEQQRQIKERLETIEGAFASAEAYFAARKADPRMPTSVRWEAFGPSLRGEKPVLISAQEMEQIQSAVTWAAKRSLKVVLVGGRDALLVVDLLKKHDVPVLVTGTHRMPRRSDADYDEAYRLPADLDEAGLKWALASSGMTGFGNDRNLPYHAAMAVAHGLSDEAALRSITLSAAEALGVSSRLGSLEEGKDATLFIADGDPLDVTTTVEAAFIEGRELDLSNKQTRLAEKYREKYRQLGETRSSGGTPGSTSPSP
ncbi:MAG: amidohydrolase family protein [Phycisphaerales bacterium]